MISLILGIIFFIIGLFTLALTWHQFLAFLVGFLPISVLVAGLIAIVAGISGINDNLKAKKDERNLKNK